MSLTASLSTAVQSLIVQEGAIQATNNNIANANTPGYSRQLVILETAPSINEGNLSVGNGVVLEGFQSVRDELLQLRIQQQTSVNSGASAQSSSMTQIQQVFTTSSQDIGTQITSLFTSLSSLSTNPSDASSRQAVVSSAQNVANAFNTTAAVLTSQQTALNTQATQDVSQINQLTQQIAALNPKINELKASGHDGGTLQDQQDQLVLSLSKLTTVSVTQTEGGETLSTGGGSPLVVGAESFALQTTTASSGLQSVIGQNGTDLTASLTGGHLGGTIQTRDVTIPALLSKLDTLANQFGAAINSAQAQGYDQNGNTGQKLFNVPATVTGSASAISVALTSATEIAASSDGSSGSNGNLANFTAVQTTALPAGQNPTDTYSSLVYQVGTLTSNASAETTATSTSLLQLNDQRSAVSGVSIDEESTNLITYQQAYEAAARVVSTIQSLFQVTMSMGTAAAA